MDMDYMIGRGSCKSFGKTLACLTGLEEEVCLYTASHVLSSIRYSGSIIRNPSLGGTFQPGGLILVGNPHRVRRLFDWLLGPVEACQRGYIALSRTHDPSVVEYYTKESSNVTLRGFTMKLLENDQNRTVSVHERDRMHQTLDALERPLIFLRNPELPSLGDSVRRALKSSPFIVEDDFDRVFNGPVDDRRGYLSFLANSLGGSASTGAGPAGKSRRKVFAYDSNHTEQTAVSFLASLDRQILREELGVSDMNALAQRSAILEAALDRTSVEDKGLTEEDIKSVPSLWNNAINEAFRHRMNGASADYTLNTPLVETTHMQMRFLDSLDSFEGPDLKCVAWMANLCSRICLGLEHLPGDVDKPLIQRTERLAEDILDRHIRLRRQITRENADVEHQLKMRAIIRALERNGPSGWKKLRRSLAIQKLDYHKPALDQLVSEGQLEVDADGVYRLQGGTK